MKPAELRKQNTKELQKQLQELKKKLGELRFQLASNKLKNVKEMHNARKDVARILTILKETPKA